MYMAGIWQKALLEVSYENDFMKIEGYAGKPEVSQRKPKL